MTSVLQTADDPAIAGLDEGRSTPPGAHTRWPWWCIQIPLGLVVVVTLNLFVGSSGFVSADEQVAHEQVEFLASGGWTRPMPEPTIDPDARWHPLNGVSPGDGVVAPYAKHPAFPLILMPFDALFGRLGRFLTVGVGAVLAASVAAVGAESRRTGSATAAFWMMLVGSPMLLHAAVLWGHSLAIAFTCVAMLGVQRVVSDHRADIAAVVLIGGGATGAVAMRSDALIFFVLLGDVLAIDGLIARWRREVALGIALGAFTIGLYLLEARWRLSILGPSSSVGLSAPSDPTFDLTIRSSLVTKWLIGNDAGPLGLLRFVGLGLLLVEAVHLRDAQASRRPLIVAGAVACFAAAVGAGSTFSFLVTAPLLVVGLALLPSADRLVSVLLATSGLFFAAIVMTSYSAAGGGDWGGRYISLLLAPLMLLAAPEIARVGGEARYRQLVVAGGLASLSIAVGITMYVRDQRDITALLLEESRVALDEFGHPGDIVVLTDARMGRLLGESNIDRRFFQVGPDELVDFSAAVGDEASTFIVFDFLNPVGLPDDWVVLDETTSSMRRVSR